MNDPRLSTEVRALLDATRDDFAPDENVRARVHFRLQARLGAELAERNGASFGLRARRWRWTIALVFGSAVAAAALWGARLVEPASDEKTPASESDASSFAARKTEEMDAKDAPFRAPSSDATGREAPEATSDTRAPASPEAARSPGVRTSASSSTPPGDPTQSLRDELEALRRANALRQSGDPAGALAILDEFERTHPKGVLVQERAAARIFALCTAGRRDEARTRAERFAARFPKSPHLPRVQQGCGSP